MSTKEIRFAKRSRFDNKGRNGFIMSTGVLITDFGYDSEYLKDDPDYEDCVTLNPVNSRGQVSDACRLSIARSALPEVIAELQAILQRNDEAQARRKPTDTVRG